MNIKSLTPAIDGLDSRSLVQVGCYRRLPPICNPNFSFYGSGQDLTELNWDATNICAGSDTESIAGYALRVAGISINCIIIFLTKILKEKNIHIGNMDLGLSLKA